MSAGAAMAKFLVEIPMDAYVRCLAKFDEESPKYPAGGVIIRGCSSHKAIIHLRCEADRIQSIMRFWPPSALSSWTTFTTILIHRQLTDSCLPFKKRLLSPALFSRKIAVSTTELYGR